MKKKTVCVYTANRSEYSRLKSAMTAIKEHEGLDLKVIVGGSHLLERYGMTVTDIEDDGFEITEKIQAVIEGTTLEAMAKSAGLAIIELTTCFSNIKPDILLVVGDRYDMLPAVISSSYLNIPIAHVQGGEKTGSIDESIRHVVTKFSHLHFPATENGRDFIIQMGENPDNVIVTGCPAIDVILDVKEVDKQALFEMPPIPAKIGQNSPVASEDYFLFIQHPITTETADSGEQIVETLKALEKYNMQTLLIYPNLDAGSDRMITSLRRYIISSDAQNLFCYKHFSIEMFVNLLRNATCIIGNSSAGIRESCYFGTPCVNIGTRQKNREHGHNVMTVPNTRKDIENAIDEQLKKGKYEPEHIYGNGNSGVKIAEALFNIDVKAQK